MAFMKAKPKQAFLKIGFYGMSGSGKTATSLLLAEGLAKAMNKKIAYCDTERGTDWYSMAVPQRKWHPAAFQFDSIYSRSLAEILHEVNSLDPKEYGVLVIDSISHVWDAAIAAYTGHRTKIGTIPISAWQMIKKPYKELMSIFINLPMHCIIAGRQTSEFDKDEESGELEKVGVKMQAEKETPYEPHILVKMYQVKSNSGEFVRGQCVAYFEKDRTGLFTGRSVAEPNFATFEPLLSLLGTEQAVVETDTSEADAGLAIDEDEKRAVKEKESARLRDVFLTRFQEAESLSELQTAWNEMISKDGARYRYKTKLLQDHFDLLQQMKDEKKTLLADKIV